MFLTPKQFKALSQWDEAYPEVLDAFIMREEVESPLDLDLTIIRDMILESAYPQELEAAALDLIEGDKNELILAKISWAKKNKTEVVFNEILKNALEYFDQNLAIKNAKYDRYLEEFDSLLDES